MTIPKAICSTVRAALDAQRRRPLPEIGGMEVAEALLSGRVDARIRDRIARFFTVQEARLARPGVTESTTRTAALYGGFGAYSWVGAAKTVNPLRDVMSWVPETLERTLRDGAWFYEFGLTPASAARLLVEHGRVWGLQPSGETFGAASVAVTTQVRRLVVEEPLQRLAALLESADSAVVLAARQDVREITRSIGLREDMPEDQSARLEWSIFVAYLIVAFEAPDILRRFGPGGATPPSLRETPDNPLRYCEAVNIYINFFHPQGARYVNPQGTRYEDLPDAMYTLIRRAHSGQPAETARIWSTLRRARDWTQQNGLSGSTFHTDLVQWQRGDYASILDTLPLDADVRPAFIQFAKRPALESR